MPQVSTPTAVSSTIDSTNAACLDIGWTGPFPSGNGNFAIQFVSRTNSSTTPVPAPSSPANGFPVTGSGTDNATFTQKLTFDSAATAQQYANQMQVQVQALAEQAADASPWGLQAWTNVGFSITVTIGSTELTLNQIPGGGVYRLPVSKSNPLVVTYDDLSDFIKNFSYGLTLPTQFPNGDPISSSLAVSCFAVDTINKTFEFDFMANVQWTIFDGLTFNALGLDIQRTNGVSLATA